VIRRYVDIADDQVSVTLEKSSDELSVLELNVTFPEEKR
jgi:cell division topological specificity factor